jgi:hypothetical protein
MLERVARKHPGDLTTPPPPRMRRAPAASASRRPSIASTRFEILRRSLTEAREALEGLPLTPEVRLLHQRLATHERVALQLHLDDEPSTPQARAEAVGIALALMLDALAARRRLAG